MGKILSTQDSCLCHLENSTPFLNASPSTLTSRDEKISEFTSDEFLKLFDVQILETMKDDPFSDVLPTFDDFQAAWNSRIFPRQRGDTLKDDSSRMNTILNSFDSKNILGEIQR